MHGWGSRAGIPYPPTSPASNPDVNNAPYGVPMWQVRRRRERMALTTPSRYIQRGAPAGSRRAMLT